MSERAMSRLPKNFSISSMPASLLFGHRRATLRPLRAADSARLLDFFRTHTPETIRLRYGYSGYEMTEERARQLASVAQRGDFALAILEREGRRNRIVAVGRCALDPEGDSAEMAFVVREDRRCLGMASLLLDALMVLARTARIETFRAQTFGDNFAMLGIFLKRGARVETIPGTEGVEVRLPIPKLKAPAMKRWRNGLKEAFGRLGRGKGVRKAGGPDSR